jgi:phosphate transport system substrate-binding protein
MKQQTLRVPIRRRTWKILALVFGSVLLLEALAMALAMFASMGWFTNRSNPGSGADRLGDSNYHINQELRRSGDWKPIVANSPFHLGELQWQRNGSTATDYRLQGETYPTIDGSTVMLPMAIEFARQHLGMSDEIAELFCQFHTTAEAYDHLLNLFATGTYYLPDRYVADIDLNFQPKGENSALWLSTTRPLDLFLGTAPSEAELAQAKANGVTPVMKPVCRDAFVFITHKDNPVNSLTLEQIRGIYAGKITNWKAVGGPDLPIDAYQREANSGSQTGMEQLVMQGTPMAPPKRVEVVQGMGSLVDAVAEYQNSAAAIGYTYQYYIDNLYKNKNIKIIKIGDNASGRDQLNENYPLIVQYYGVIRKGDEQANGGRFLDWILSDEGQACVRQAGYFPLENKE